MNVPLAGPQSITFFKNVSSTLAGGELVYLGGTKPVPAPRAAGVHPGRWVDPASPAQLASSAGTGRFLAVATKGPTRNVSPGDVGVLVQRLKHTHLVVIASDDIQVLNPAAVDYPFFRWVYVLAMAQTPAGTGVDASWFKRGWRYQAFANSALTNKDSYRQQVWAGFGNSMVGGSLPPVPTVSLTAPSCYP